MQSTNPENQTPAKTPRKISPYLAGPWFTLVLALMMLATYLLDIATPLGVPIWLLYFIPLFLSFWSRPYYAVPTVCAVALLFLVAGFIFSPQGEAFSWALIYRFIFALLFTGTSAALWVIRRKQVRAEILYRS